MLPLAPSITIPRPAETLKGEKKTFADLSLSASCLDKASMKEVLALDREADDDDDDDAIVSATEEKSTEIIIMNL